MTDKNFVTLRQEGDFQLLEASLEKARQTFRDFWCQVALDFNNY